MFFRTVANLVLKEIPRRMEPSQESIHIEKALRFHFPGRTKVRGGACMATHPTGTCSRPPIFGSAALACGSHRNGLRSRLKHSGRTGVGLVIIGLSSYSAAGSCFVSEALADDDDWRFRPIRRLPRLDRRKLRALPIWTRRFSAFERRPIIRADSLARQRRSLPVQ
jgi:hypothetical protein